MDRDFIDLLRDGPALLFLGQRHLALETGEDPLLRAAWRKYGLPPEEPPSYARLLDSGFGSETPASAAWFNQKSQELAASPWLETVAGYAWSAFVTSAFDSVWVDALRRPWREVVPVYDERRRPAEPRDPFNLHATVLFGCVRWPETAPVPLDDFDKRARSQAAVAMLRRLPDVLTPRGVLAIDGYSAGDWLAPEDLAPVLAQLGPRQAHLFSVRDDLASHPDTARLAERGVLILHGESLASALLQGAEQGRIRLGEPPELRDGQHPLHLKNLTVSVPRDLWHRVSRHGQVLDDTIFEPLSPLSEAANYYAFRDFLSRSEGVPNWDGFRRGYAFSRDAERPLHEAVARELASARLQEHPIVLHGPTGTGKTIALARLALSIREEARAAVIYVPRGSLAPSYADLDAFCEWTENAASARTVIVWDGMVSIDEYYDLVRFFNSRGRKTVVVGSTYRIDAAPSRRPLIEMPDRLSESEAQRFREYLIAVDPILANRAPLPGVLRSEAFLVSLYRLLPTSRAQLRSGVVLEVGAAESGIAQLEEGHGSEIVPLTAMQHALLDAGVLTDLPPLRETVSLVDGEALTGLQRLTGLVMVPGQFGLKVPLELLMRTLGRPGYTNFVDLLRGTDVFQWYEDELGNIAIGPRNALEAELVVQARLGSSTTEVAFVKSLIEDLTGTDLDGGHRESTFVSSLVQALDSSERQHRYRAHFRDIAHSLRQARVEGGAVSPQLMLQEAHLLREWAFATRTFSNDDDPAIAEAFDAAMEVAREALQVVEQTRRSRFMRGNLLVELASTLAGSALERARAGDLEGARERYWLSRDVQVQARGAIPDSYHPLDVLGWSTLDLIDTGILNEEDQAEALAGLIAAFQTTDPSTFGTGSQERFLTRQLRVGDAFDRFDLSESAFSALRERGSASGYILRALATTGGRRAREWDAGAAAEALAYLEAHDREIGNDARALELRLDLWWVTHVGEPMLTRERLALAFGPSEWLTLLDLIDRLRFAGDSFRPVILDFLAALASFHLGNYNDAFRTFRDVERDSEDLRTRWRVVRSFVASKPNGEPRQFHGIIADVFANGLRGEAFVEEIQRRVPILASDFGYQQLERDHALGTFHIAFSLRGPIVEPMTLYTQTRDRERHTREGTAR